MLQKRSFKVLSPISKAGGGQYWLRLGTAYVNKDESINVYLDAWPKEMKLQLRAFTDEDYRPRPDGTPSRDAQYPDAPAHLAHHDAPHASTSNSPPF